MLGRVWNYISGTPRSSGTERVGSCTEDPNTTNQQPVRRYIDKRQYADVQNTDTRKKRKHKHHRSHRNHKQRHSSSSTSRTEFSSTESSNSQYSDTKSPPRKRFKHEKGLTTPAQLRPLRVASTLSPSLEWPQSPYPKWASPRSAMMSRLSSPGGTTTFSRPLISPHAARPAHPISLDKFREAVMLGQTYHDERLISKWQLSEALELARNPPANLLRQVPADSTPTKIAPTPSVRDKEQSGGTISPSSRKRTASETAQRILETLNRLSTVSFPS